MKLEYLPDGSLDCPLIRLYEFTETEAANLLAKIAELAQGSKISVALHDLSFITPIDNCELILITADNDQGILPSDDANLFMCMLNTESWKQIVGLIDPFCSPAGSKGFKWLDETSDISLLLSPSGKW